MLPINPIIAAAAADIVVGMIIYSDFAFGKMWAKVSGVRCSNKDLPLRFAGQAVASLMTASALYIAIITLKSSELPYGHALFTKIYSWFFDHSNLQQTDIMSALKISGFVWLGFIVPFILSNAIWCSAINWRKAVLKAIFKLIHVLAMASALAYFG